MALETSTFEEPYLTIQHQPAGFFLHRRFLRSFVPVALVALFGVALLLVSGNVLLPFDPIVTVEGKLASKTRLLPGRGGPANPVEAPPPDPYHLGGVPGHSHP